MILTKTKIVALLTATLASYAATARHDASMGRPSNTLEPITITGAPLPAASPPAPVTAKPAPPTPVDPCPCDPPPSLRNR